MLLITKFSWNVCKKLWERKVEIKGNRWMTEKIPLIEEVGWRRRNSEEVFYRHKHKYIVFGHTYIDKEKLKIKESND
jgi:hypothetical protein